MLLPFYEKVTPQKTKLEASISFDVLEGKCVQNLTTVRAE